MLKNFLAILTSILKKVKLLFSLMGAIGMAVQNVAIFHIPAHVFGRQRLSETSRETE